MIGSGSVLSLQWTMYRTVGRVDRGLDRMGLLQAVNKDIVSGQAARGVKSELSELSGLLRGSLGRHL